MKNIIPFKKDIIFKTKLGEITSISLENTLKLIDGVIEGDFIISGEYKEDIDSENEKPFNLKLPFKSIMDDRFTTDKAVVDIDDFYYEIKDNNILLVSIDVLIDKLEEKPLIELNNNIEEEKNIEQEVIQKDDMNIEIRNIDSDEIKDKITTIFNTDSEDKYVTYNVCIIRDGDTIETILERYKIDKELLEKYNDITELKKGDKLLIPSETE